MSITTQEPRVLTEGLVDREVTEADLAYLRDYVWFDENELKTWIGRTDMMGNDVRRRRIEQAIRHIAWAIKEEENSVLNSSLNRLGQLHEHRMLLWNLPATNGESVLLAITEPLAMARLEARKGVYLTEGHYQTLREFLARIIDYRRNNGLR